MCVYLESSARRDLEHAQSIEPLLFNEKLSCRFDISSDMYSSYIERIFLKQMFLRFILWQNRTNTLPIRSSGVWIVQATFGP